MWVSGTKGVSAEVTDGLSVRVGSRVAAVSISVEAAKGNCLRAVPEVIKMIITRIQRHAPTARAIAPAMIQDCFDFMKTSTDVEEILSWDKS